MFGFDYGNLLGQVRSLGEMGIKPTAILIESKQHLICYSKYIGDCIYVSSIEEGYNTLISKYGALSIKTFIFTDSDGVVLFLAGQNQEIRNKFIFFNSSRPEYFKKYSEKEAQIELAKRHGLMVPKTVVYPANSWDNTTFPVFIKACNSLVDGWKGVANICSNQDELKQNLELIGNKDIVIQELILKKNEIHFEGISVNDGKEIYLPLQGGYYRLREKSYGTYKYLEPLSDEYSSIFGSINKMMEDVGFNGIFEVEFIDNGRELIFMEINFRPTAFNYSFTAMGLNFIKIWIDSIISGKLIKPQTVRSLQRFNMMQEIPDFFEFVLTRKLSFKHWIKDVKETDDFRIYNKKDPYPFIMELLRLCRYGVGRLFLKLPKVRK